MLQIAALGAWFRQDSCIGPEDEQRNASVPGGSLFHCGGTDCIAHAEALCAARAWCRTLAIEDLKGDGSGGGIQLYSAGPGRRLPGHPRWTYFSDSRLPPAPTPFPPAVPVCAVRGLAAAWAEGLLRRPSEALEPVLGAVRDALRLRAECGGRTPPPVVPPASGPGRRAAEAAGWTVHVDCDGGDDGADGLSADRPLRTLGAAVGALRAAVERPAVLRVRGECHLPATLQLDAAAVGAGLTIASYPGEPRALISGGVALEGLRWAAGPRPGVQVAKLPANAPREFAQLWAERAGDGGWRRAVRSRHPDGNPEENGLWVAGNPGYLPSTAAKSLGSFRQTCAAVPPAELCNRTVPHFGYGRFVGGRDASAGYEPSFEPYWCGLWTGCKGIEYSAAGPDFPALPTDPAEASRMVVHSTRGTSDIWANFQWAVANHSKGALRFAKGGYQFPRGTRGPGWWFVDNAGVDALTAPGEWYASRGLLFMRTNGTEPLPSRVVVSNLTTLIKAAGSDAAPLGPLTLANLSFAHSEVTYLEPYETPSGGGYSVARRAAVEVWDAQSPSILGSSFDGIGGNGLLLSNRIRGAVVADNDFARVGDTAVVLLGTTRYCDATAGTQPRGTVVHRNAMRELGLFGKQGAGLFQSLAMGTTVSHNIIFNGPRAGILFNDGMGGRHLVERNLLFNLVRETTDHGPFNSWDRVPYIADNTGKPIGPAQSNITRNLVLCNYECTWPIDHDDGIFGKIHNDQHRWLCNEDPQTEPFDHIETECSPCGGYYRTGHNDWVRKATHDDRPELFTVNETSTPWGNYSEANYGNMTATWIGGLVAKKQLPFFAFIGTSGPHLGVVPAPWHRRRTAELQVQAPRTPNFNMHAADHHPFVATAPPFGPEAIKHLDLHMRDRWGTLFSIDDMVAGLHSEVKRLGILDSTYLMFTSDHGYHLGQFRIPDEKMMPYETDIRVPFWAAGPGIAPGTQLHEMISNIDIGPTLCDLAGIQVPNLMDGRSLVPLLTKGAGAQVEAKLDRPWRTHFMTEFAEGGWQEWGHNTMWDTDATFSEDFSVHPPWGFNCSVQGQCPANKCRSPEQCPEAIRHDYAYDDPSYNWRALRVINATDNFLFAQWDPEYIFEDRIQPAELMPGVNVIGPDSPSPCPAAPFGNKPAQCEAACRGDQGCVAWTLHRNSPGNQRAPGWRCCRKTSVQGLERGKANMTSGVLRPSSVPVVANMTKVAFSEFYDVARDPWHMTNLWPKLPRSRQAALMEEIASRARCHGTRTTPSTCE